ncbi:hypothetical protein RHSIM_Rhsim04G0084600 [Rhododendron simsii]|uniref:Uncharacterized protein n=1 Tax=Rhododendron simsii TaxID=118357 RepID=A0A834LTD8_RHOSS|nr:hypothetical protein RHSIM_Rhsim04G0084600 [Rhododendron simsii]
MLWLTAMIPQMKPAPCDQITFVQCDSPSLTQYTMLFASSGLISIGAGCIRPCSMAFGLDKLDNEENPNNQRVLESYIHWYNASTAFSAVVAITATVYIQDHLGWQVGFAVPAFLMVLLVAFKHRNISLPPSLCDDRYRQGDEAKLLAPTGNLRATLDPWNLCTVEQVESLKAFLRVKPVWSTGIMAQVSVTQNSFATLQAKTMDRHIASDFQIPAGSISVFMVLMQMMLYGIYECIMVPLIARYTGKQHALGPKTRMGIGLLISCIGMATSATPEHIRQANSIEFNPDNKPNAGFQMSAMWLVPQFGLLGAFWLIYTQFSKSMASIAVALYTQGMAVRAWSGAFWLI